MRFVQVWSGADNGFPRRNWDSHEDIARDHGVMGASMDKPAAALLRDLKARGLFAPLTDPMVRALADGRLPSAEPFYLADLRRLNAVNPAVGV